MKYEFKRLLFMGWAFGCLGILLMVLKAKRIDEILKVFLRSTVIFLPIAYSIIKYKLYETGEFSKKYSKSIAYVTFILVIVMLPFVSEVWKRYIFIVAFETICVCTFMLLYNVES